MDKVLMMKCRHLIAFVGLICCTALRVEAHVGVEAEIDPAGTIATRKPAKLYTQAVLRPDGYVVDRLAEPYLDNTFSPEYLRSMGGIPNSPEAWLTRMLDPSRNGLVAKHPELLAEWLDAITEPRFMTALASIVTSPQAYTNTLGKLADPATSRNWAEFADPRIMFRWMALGMDPKFYQAVFLRMTDAEKMRRWGGYPSRTENLPSGIEGAREVSARESTLRHGDQWMQLPSRETKNNPWLSNATNYRY